MRKWPLLLLPLLGLISCSRTRRTYSGAPVVLISIDTLRADHLPAYGYAGVRTPAIDGLRQDGILYSDAISHVPLTLPSHTTIFTGLLPPQDGVRDNLGYTLGKDHVTLAEAMKTKGYATGAAVSAVVLARSTGISRGFDDYDDDVEAPTDTAAIALIQRSGFETEKVAEGWIAAHQEKPFFYFLHLYEPHSPYDPPEPFKTIYREHPYDGEIATADAILGRFFDFLKREKLYDRAVIILLADHGEGLGNHGEEEHGIFLYRDTLHVPLILKLPGEKDRGKAVGGPVGLVDIFPTVAALTGASPPPHAAGRPLPLPGTAAPDRRIYSETLYPRYHFGWSDLAALSDERYEYIQAPKPELYDYRSDPQELDNLAGSLPPAFRSLRLALLEMPRPRQAPGASNPEQVKQLASLGYIGAAAPPETAQNLPDPKDHIGELGDLKMALKADHEGNYREAIALFRRLLHKNPLMIDGWTQLANDYHKLGLFDQAISALQSADRLAPGSPITLASMAVEYLQKDDLEQAELYAKRSIAVNGPPQAHEVLASVRLARKDFDGAEQEARRALQSHRGLLKPLIVLAQIAKARGDLQGALRELDSIVEKENAQGKPTRLSNVSSLRGDILARLGRTADAEAAFHDEIDHFPNNASAWSGLAFLYASQGRVEDARKTLFELIQKSPNPRSFQTAARAFQILGDPRQAARCTELARRATHADAGGS